MKSKIPFIPYGRQHIFKGDIAAVIKCLSSEHLTQGPAVPLFEAALEKKTSAKHAVAVANGTAALHLLALSLGLKRDSEVIVSPISFLATSNCLLYAGLKPIFADVDSVTGNLTVDTVQKKINRKTKAIFLTHLAGNPCDLEGLEKLAKKNNLFLIEDAAHALGAKYRNAPIGNCRYSDAAIFSFHPLKHITTGEGGAVVTNNALLAEKISILRTHGVTRDPKKLHANPGRWHYEMHELGFNYRLSDIQAALGLAQLGHLDEFIKARRSIAGQYSQLLENFKNIGLPSDFEGSSHAYHLYPVRLLSQSLRSAKQKIFDDLFKQGVGAQVHYIPIPSQPYYKKLGYTMRGLDTAKIYFESTISLPIYFGMRSSQIKRVVEIFKNVIKRY